MTQRKLLQIQCKNCGFTTEVNPHKRRNKPKYCRRCGSVILAAHLSESLSREGELVELHRGALKKALRLLHRVLGDTEEERMETLRSMSGMAPREIREACRAYRRKIK
jgi:NAD-dependent SIR2 family protein deacetylase